MRNQKPLVNSSYSKKREKKIPYTSKAVKNRTTVVVAVHYLSHLVSSYFHQYYQQDQNIGLAYQQQHTMSINRQQQQQIKIQLVLVLGRPIIPSKRNEDNNRHSGVGRVRLHDIHTTHIFIYNLTNELCSSRQDQQQVFFHIIC